MVGLRGLLAKDSFCVPEGRVRWELLPCLKHCPHPHLLHPLSSATLFLFKEKRQMAEKVGTE